MIEMSDKMISKKTMITANTRKRTYLSFINEITTILIKGNKKTLILIIYCLLGPIEEIPNCSFNENEAFNLTNALFDAVCALHSH